MSEAVTGRSAIVAGAAQGIGLAIARRLVRAGAEVVLADPDERRLEAAMAALEEAPHRGRISGFCCNLRERLDIANLLAAAMEAQEGLDILVDAHLLAAPSDLMESADGLEAAFAQNVAARLRLAQLAARRMRTLAEAEEEAAVAGADPAPRDRAILFLGATPRAGAPAELAALAASMGALGPMARGLALRLAPQGVRVNVLAVGAPPPAEEAAAPLPSAESHEAAAEAALFLISPAARAVTGQTLAADAGRSLLAGG